jgi:ABC-type dipeptide/oligopeptide/nickel transport system permease subunit
MQDGTRAMETDFLPLPPDTLEADAVVRKSTSYAADVWRNFRKRRTAVVSFAILCVLLFFVIFGPGMNKYDYYSNDYASANLRPDAETLVRHRRPWPGPMDPCMGRRPRLAPPGPARDHHPLRDRHDHRGNLGLLRRETRPIIMRGIDILMGIPPLIYMILLMVILGSGNIMTLVLAMSLTGG